MSYLEEISKQIVDEYKSGNQEKRVFLQTLKAALQKKQIDLKDKYNGEVELSTLKNELKQLEESLKEQKDALRDDLTQATQDKIEILRAMLPEQISEGELKAQIERIVNGLDDKSFPNAIKLCMCELKFKADGGKIAQTLKEVLGM